MQQKYIDINGLKYLVDRLKSQMDIYLGKKYNSEDTVTATNKLQTRFITLTDSEGNTDKVLFNGTADVEFTKPLSTVYIKELFENLLDSKVDVVEGYMLSSNEFTDELKTKLENLAYEANKYIHPETHVASVLIQDENNRLVSDIEKAVYSDKYTKEEFDSEMNLAVENISWLPAVETYSDILVKYPNPVDGNVVNVNDTDITYRYTGSEWIAISANAIPLASADVDGKMSKENFIKLEGIEANANNYKHDETHNATIIVEDSEHRFATDEEITRWNDVDSKEVQDFKLSAKMDLDNFVDKLNIDSVFDDVFNKRKSVFRIESTEFTYVSPGKFFSSWGDMYLNGVKVNEIPYPCSGVIEIHDCVLHDVYDANKSLSSAFEFNNNTTAVLDLDTSNVTNMSYMFTYCSGLASLDLSNFDTSNVTNMFNMFYNCAGLTSLDLSNFDTSNVTDMSYMFTDCVGLASLDLSNFDTSNVTNMCDMFENCAGLTSLDLSNFDTSNVTDMSYMFTYCLGLTSLDLSNFDTSNVTDMRNMFTYCSGLTSLDLSNFDTSNVTYMSYMFAYCVGLASLDLSNFDTSNVTDMGNMFYNCAGLTSLDLSNFDTSNVTNMFNMFANCTGLTSLDLSNFDTSNVMTMSYMFAYCSGLASLDLSNFDTSNVMNMSYMFYNCAGLTSLDLSNFDTSNVTNMFNMFENCAGLTSLDLSNFDTSNVTDMSYMFTDCLGLASLDLSNFDTSNVTDMRDMFRNILALSDLFMKSPDMKHSTVLAISDVVTTLSKPLSVHVYDASKCEGLSYDNITYIY